MPSMPDATIKWAGCLVRAGIALSDLQSSSRRGKVDEMIEAARKLQREANALVTWIEEDRKAPVRQSAPSLAELQERFGAKVGP